MINEEVFANFGIEKASSLYFLSPNTLYLYYSHFANISLLAFYLNALSSTVIFSNFNS
jgi:hypothetical protein